jgi:phosphocarrier protein HPr
VKKKEQTSKNSVSEKREITIKNKYGLHARPAAIFVKKAKNFSADITVEKDGSKVSAKSIMGLLTIEGYQGSKLKIEAVGKDAVEAIDALQELVEVKFVEEEGV